MLYNIYCDYLENIKIPQPLMRQLQLLQTNIL